MVSSKIKSILVFIAILIFFILSSWLVQSNLDIVTGIIGEGFTGMTLYVLVNVLAIVVAPISILPLIPIASALWGGFLTGILNIISWTIGAMIAFAIARILGEKIVRKMISLDRIEKIEKKIPQKNLFFGIIFMRIILPVDILSYALGLLTKVKVSTYFWATLIGITPFAFIWAYAGGLPLEYQIYGFFFSLVILVLFIILLVFRDFIKKRRS